MNLFSLMECTIAGLAPIMTVFGWVLLGIKILAPVILIIVGMVDMTKAMTQKNEDDVKKAQKALGKKAIAGVVVFLVVTIVGVIMGLVGGTDYKSCAECLNHPSGDGCQITTEI